MTARGANCVIVLLTVTVLGPAADAGAQQRNDRWRAEAEGGADTRGGWPRVHIPDPVAGRALRTALDRAWVSLQDPDCNRVLTAFSDRRGQTLEARLVTLGVGAQEHLTRIVFIDNTRERRCVTGVLAFTEPGSYVVRLCVEEFKRAWQQDQRRTVAAVIHEMLHTLGLGENPPTSNEITSTVFGICHPR
jgi:hypothetical protein